MTVSVSEILKGNVKTDRQEVFDFLHDNSDTGFTFKELQNKFGYKTKQLSSVLQRLRKVNAITNQSGYWFLTRVKETERPKKKPKAKPKKVKIYRGRKCK